MASTLEQQISRRFKELRNVTPGELSSEHRLLWKWLAGREELEKIFEWLDRRALDIPRIDELACEVFEHSAPMSVLSSLQSSEDYAALALIIAEDCVASTNDQLELEFTRRLGARDDEEAVALFYETILEPIAQHIIERLVAANEFAGRVEQQEEASFSSEPALSGGPKGPSVVQQFKAVQERLKQGARLAEVADEMGESESYVTDLLKLRLVSERMRLLVHHQHYADELAKWDTYRLEAGGIRFHPDDDDNVVIHGISWKNALAMGEFVADYQRKNDLTEERAIEIVHRYFMQTDIPFECSEGTGYGLIDAARLLSHSDFSGWLADAADVDLEVLLHPLALRRFFRPTGETKRALSRMGVDTVVELLDIDFDRSDLDPSTETAMAIKGLQEQALRRFDCSSE